MAKLKWLALMPVLAAVLVFGSNFFSGSGSKPDASTESSRPIIPDSWRSGEARNGPADKAAAMDLTELSLSLLAVLGLAIGAIWLLKKLQRGTQTLAQPGSIQIKETRRLSAKRALHIVRVSDRLLLLADGEAGLSLVADLTPRDVDDPAAAPDVAAAALSDDPLSAGGAEPRDFVLRAAARQAPLPQKQAPANLGNFRELLARLGQADA